MSVRSFVLVLLLLFFIVTFILFVNDFFEMPKDKQKENENAMVMASFLIMPVIFVLLNLTIRSIIRDRFEERYYIYRQKQLYKESNKEEATS